MAFLNISSQALRLLRQQNKISFLQLPDQIEYFGYQLLEYLAGSVHTATDNIKKAPAHDRIIRAAEVEKMTGLSRTTIWRMEKYKSFPARVSLGRNSVGWRLSEIQKWVESRNKL